MNEINNLKETWNNKTVQVWISDISNCYTQVTDRLLTGNLRMSSLIKTFIVGLEIKRTILFNYLCMRIYGKCYEYVFNVQENFIFACNMKTLQIK